MFNKGFDDEVFICRELNLQINIDELIVFLNENTSKYEIIKLDIGDFDSFVLADRLDDQTLEAMQDVRVHEPLICADLSGHVRVIDGNHRLAKRKKLGLEHCYVVMVPFRLLSDFIEPSSPISKRMHKKWFTSIQCGNV
jgi:hypothetical protein